MTAVESPSDVDQNLSNLWKAIGTLFKSTDFNGILRDVAILEFFVPEECFPEQLLNMLDQDKKVKKFIYIFV